MRKALITFFGILILLFVFASQGVAQRHHLTYSGPHFSGDAADNFHRQSSGIGNWGSAEAWFSAPVNFPDSANGMQVTRLSCTVRDNSTTGMLQIQLYKVDRWSGLSKAVAWKGTEVADAANFVRCLNTPKSQMMARGIDNNRWAWFLVIYFSEGNTDLVLFHATIRYE